MQKPDSKVIELDPAAKWSGRVLAGSTFNRRCAFQEKAANFSIKP
jgi:hypothetical protein